MDGVAELEPHLRSNRTIETGKSIGIIRTYHEYTTLLDFRNSSVSTHEFLFKCSSKAAGKQLLLLQHLHLHLNEHTAPT